MCVRCAVFVMMNEKRKKKKKHILFLSRRKFTFASKNKHSLHVGWRNLFSSCAVVFGSGGKKVLVYICMYYLEYNSCVVVLVFWLLREIVFGVMYILSVQYSCAVVSVFWL